MLYLQTWYSRALPGFAWDWLELVVETRSLDVMGYLHEAHLTLLHDYFYPTIYTCAKNREPLGGVSSKLRDFLVGSAHVRSQGYSCMHAFMHAEHAVCMGRGYWYTFGKERAYANCSPEVPKVARDEKSLTFLRLPFTLRLKVRYETSWHFRSRSHSGLRFFWRCFARVFMRCC